MSSATASKCLCDNPSPARKLLVELSMSLVKSYVSLVVLKIRQRSVSRIILFTSKPNDGSDKGSGEFAFNALVAVDARGMEAQLVLQDHELFL